MRTTPAGRRRAAGANPVPRYNETHATSRNTYVYVEPILPAPLEPLRTIANNLYWTWNTDARALFERIDRERWEASGHNPIKLLQTVPRERSPGWRTTMAFWRT